MYHDEWLKQEDYERVFMDRYGGNYSIGEKRIMGYTPFEIEHNSKFKTY